jgi:transposase
LRPQDYFAVYAVISHVSTSINPATPGNQSSDAWIEQIESSQRIQTIRTNFLYSRGYHRAISHRIQYTKHSFLLVSREPVKNIRLRATEGQSNRRIAAEMTLTRNTVRLWRDRWHNTAEQIVQIVAISCEDPQLSGVPISHWTPKEVAAAAIQRGIVTRISERQVGRFLKRGGS